MKKYAWLNKLYEIIAEHYMLIFCEMMQKEGMHITDARWGGGVVGGVLCFSDTYHLTFDELRYVVHNGVSYTQIIRWADHCNEMHEYGLTPPSLADWVNGKSTISMDKLERIRELKREFDECISSVREEY